MPNRNQAASATNVCRRSAGVSRVAALAVLLLGAFLAAAGCSSGDSSAAAEEPATTSPNTAVLLSASANSFEQAILEGVKRGSESVGGGEVREFDGKFDSATQISQIQDVTTSGNYDVLIIEPVDATAVVKPLEQAAAAGIKVVCVTTPCGDDAESLTNQFEGQTGLVAYSFGAIAEQLAEAGTQACDGVDPCEIAHLNGDSTFASDRLAADTIKSAVASQPNMELVAQLDGKYDTATSRQITQDILQRNPELSVIIAQSDQMAVGAEQAIEAAGLLGDVKIISAGASERGVQAVADGDWFAEVIGQPRSVGERAAEIGILSAQGEDPGTVEVDGFTLSPTGSAILTQDNIADFEAEWK